MKKAVLFGGTDGHGIAMTAISKRALEREGYDVIVVCEFNQRPFTLPVDASPADYGTGIPALFWGSTFLARDFSFLVANDLIVVVDIPLPEPDNRYPGCTAEKGIAKIAEICSQGIRVLIIDHHKIAPTFYGKAILAGAEILISSSAVTTHYGLPDAHSVKWGRIGAICDRDKAVLPVTADEERLAHELDQAKVRIPESLSAIYSDDSAFFSRFDSPVSVPGYSPYRHVVYAPSLTPKIGLKQLDILCQQENKEYGIGVLGDPPVVIAITNWKKEHLLPAALKLGLSQFRGHAEAPNFYYPIEDIENLISRLDTVDINKPTDSTQISQDNLFGYIAGFMRKIDIPYFLTIHGWSHVEHVISHARTLGSLCLLSSPEQNLLDWASLLHDVGNGAMTEYGVNGDNARTCHHAYSYCMVRDWGDLGIFPDTMSHEEIRKVADLCLRHRKFMNLPNDSAMQRLCILLRVADSMDIDERRAQRNDEGKLFLDLKDHLPPGSVDHWESHRAIHGLRLRVYGTMIEFQFFVTDREKSLFQIDNFTEEIRLLEEYFSLKVTVHDLNLSEGYHGR